MHYPYLAFGYLLLTSLLSTTAMGRSIYLNGMDISSARNQTLNEVNLRIDENGHIFIEAPHYQVNEESTFTPLSSWLSESTRPKHLGKGEKPSGIKPLGQAAAMPETRDQEIAKSIPDPEEPASDAPTEDPAAPKLQEKPGEPAGGEG